MKMILTLAAVAMLMQSPSGADNSAEYYQRIDTIAKIASDYAGFNGTILVADESGIIFEKSYGYADQDESIPLTPEHRFSPGSIDKEFTTAAMVLLEEQGLISYSDPLHKYLPSLPAWGKAVTIEQILTHTSGLPDIQYGRGLTTAAAIDQIMAVEDLLFPPGEGFQYGNLHSVLRAMVIEKVSGQPQDTFIKKQIFAAAGMTTAFSKTDIEATSPLVAEGDVAMAVAGIDQYVTPRDLYFWETALWSGKIINQESLNFATQPHALSGNYTRAYFDFGWFTSNDDGSLARIQHDGTHPRHYALQSIDFNSGLVIVLLSRDGNKATLEPLNRAITELADKPSIPIPVSWWLTAEQNEIGMLATIEKLRVLIENGERQIPDESILNDMGYALGGSGDIDAALGALKANVGFYPSSANAHDSYASFLLEAGKYDEATRIAERGIMLAQDSGEDFLVISMTSYLEKIRAAD